MGNLLFLKIIYLLLISSCHFRILFSMLGTKCAIKTNALYDVFAYDAIKEFSYAVKKAEPS